MADKLEQSSSTKIIKSKAEVQSIRKGKLSPIPKTFSGRRTLFGKITTETKTSTSSSSPKPTITQVKSHRSTGLSVSKLPLKKFSSAKISSSAVNRRSHIPRAVFLANSIILEGNNPQSNSAREVSKSTPNSAALIRVPQTLQQATVIAQESNGSTTTVQRKNSNIIVAFQRRRSQSQMEFSPQTRRAHAQQYGKYQCQQYNDYHHSPIDQSHIFTEAPNCVKDKVNSKMSSTTFLLHKIYDHRLYEGLHTPEAYTAGMRIFCHIMLNAWRKRRDEVRRLMEETNELKRGAVKSKNQLHVFNSLFRMEQKRNDELSTQLKSSLEDCNATKSSCEGLTTSLISLKADKALLEQQIQIKDQEYQNLNVLLNQTKADLLKAISGQREIQANLSIEQHKVHVLENQKNELINEIYELNNEANSQHQVLQLQIDVKNQEIQCIQNNIEEIKKNLELAQLTNKNLVRDHNLYEENMVNDVTALRKEVENLQGCLQKTFLNRIKACWINTMKYQQYTFHVLHWATYILLPATPPPKAIAPPLSLGVTKSLSVIKN